MFSKAHSTCLRQQKPRGKRKKKVANVEGITKALGDKGGIGALEETKERTKKIDLGEIGLCQQFPEFFLF